MSSTGGQLILCNGAETHTQGDDALSVTRLEYRRQHGQPPTIAIELPSFVRSLGTLPDRYLDLLELASYVYCADRQISRGTRDSLEFHPWSRRMRLRMRVRDRAFWTSARVQQVLSSLLEFLTGDEEWAFDFQAGHATPAVSLFDTKEFDAPRLDTEVCLFSGGIDSLAGAVSHLATTATKLCLVSHRSRQPSIARTQEQLVRALNERFPDRVFHYKFTAHLVGTRAVEETQRTRFFLYSSMAFALSGGFGKAHFTACENGVTSLNFPRRQDGMRGRTSRTTHPRTIAALCQLFSLVSDQGFQIRTPFMWMTKAQVLQTLKDVGHIDLLPSTVSCTKTFVLGHGATHCGCCFQCIDRQLAVAAQELENSDNRSLYGTKLATDRLDGESKTAFVDYVRQALNNGVMGLDRFATEFVNELASIAGHVGSLGEAETIEQVWQLFQAHNVSVRRALRRLQSVHDDPGAAIVPDSALALINQRAYFKDPIQHLVTFLSGRLAASIPIAFEHQKPERESGLNDHIQAILSTDQVRIEREHPALRYATAKAVPDHKVADHELVIEGKYVRDTRSPSSITDEIAADITKYSAAGHIVFVVYDPSTRIVDRQTFKEGIEASGNCTVIVAP